MEAHCGNKLANLVISTTFVLLLLQLLVDAAHDTTHKHKTASTQKSMNRELSFEIILHGLVLWVSMGLLMPVGILTIRACSKQDCGRRLKIVFYSHVTLQMLAVVLATAGAIMSIKNFENAFNNHHQKVGLVLYGMAWLQPLLGYCRPHRGSKGRSCWFFVHWFLGTGTSILGIVNIYTGLQAYHKKSGSSVNLWTFLFTVQASVMAFLYLLQDKWAYMKKQGVIIGNEPIIPTTTDHSQQYTSKDAQELNAPCLEAVRV